MSIKPEVGKTYWTRDGRRARVKATDAKFTVCTGAYPVLGLVDNAGMLETAHFWTSDGKSYAYTESSLDLVSEVLPWEVQKTYRHAGGKVCTILATDLRGSQPIVGRTYNNGGDAVNRFRADGTFGGSWGKHALDLTAEECEVPNPLPGDIF